MKRFASIFLAAMLAACASTPDAPDGSTDASAPAPDTQVRETPVEWRVPERTVILVGLDGLRWDMIDIHDAPHLNALADRGVRSNGLIPVMPSKTFANFYAIASGLHPDRSGIIGNRPYDRVFDADFARDAHQDGRWWGGDPIWNVVQRAGYRAHTLFWLGSEAEINGMRPYDWRPYEHEYPAEDRIADVLGWLDLEGEARPALITVYFDHVDSAAHVYGPEAPETGEAVALVDAQVGALVAGIEERGMTDEVDIIIVSDHGMSETSPDRVIRLTDYSDFDGLYTPGGWTAGGDSYEQYDQIRLFYGPEDAVERAYAELAGAHPELFVYRRNEIPARWRMDHPDRGPDLFVTSDPNWLLYLGGRESRWGATLGSHGYDRHAPDMRGSFIAAGPGFASGVRVAEIENINIHALIAHLLGVEPADTDGDIRHVCRTLATGCAGLE